jgi:DNA-directed RNA polymerase specialized sigma24 family protein
MEPRRDLLDRLYRRYHHALFHHLRRQFPVLDLALVEEDVQATFLWAASHLDRLTHLANDRVRGSYLHKVAWRTSRGRVRRRSWKLETCERIPTPTDAGPERVYQAVLDWDHDIETAIVHSHTKDSPRLRRALNEHLLRGAKVQEAAGLAGLRREPVSRAAAAARRLLAAP